jgi:hypothetical protein
MRRIFAFLLVAITTLLLPGSALAQDYYFQNPEKIVHVYWNEDGTSTIQYYFAFQNDPSGHSIEFVDVGMPNAYFDTSSISAEVDGRTITYISTDEFLGNGPGVAFGLESGSIPPGQFGNFMATIGRVERVLYPDDDDTEYASAVFVPAYFDSSVVYGVTETTVVFHLPPGVQSEEPRWHSAPGGFNETPETGFDDQGRITYTWYNATAEPDSYYSFGASFPAKYVPEDSIIRSNAISEWIANLNVESLIPCGCIGAFAIYIIGGIWADQKRRRQYLPPKITMQGQGIKRGLTAVEAAVLLEQPLDKIMTMILFASIKKNAVQVVKREPLELEFASPQPEGLQSYEIDFVNAFRTAGKTRQGELQNMAVNLVKTVANKMRGFSSKETKEYYRSIMEKAWQQVEAAETPEVRSQKFDEVMEWTMLDRNYDDRTRDIFRNQPVLIPRWWGGFDPAYRSGAGKVSPSPVSSSGGGGSASLPNLPGSDFAASIVNGVQSFSGGVIGSLSEFTNNVTQKTNPIPVTRSSGGGGRSRGGGGGSSCACACACAGCACACAGGGR